MIKVYSRRQLMAFKPYDAEIEYLESSGTQYIASGILFAVGLKVTVDAQCVGNYSSIQIIAGPGAGASQWLGSTVVIGLTDPNWGLGNDKTQVIGSSKVRTLMTVTYNAGSTTLSGNNKTVTLPRSSNPTTNPINFFSGRNNFYSTARIYSAKITNSNNVVLVDLIPVRVGNVGYMYDKVSGKLFGNSGTGSFVLGPDK